MWSVHTRTMAIACNLVAAVMLTKPAVGQPSVPSIALKPPIPIEQNPHLLRFRERDTDADGILNETEYIIGAGRERKAVQREFKVFDADGDARLNLNEFLTVPIGQPENQRGVIDDPVIQLAEKRLAELMMSWGKWDTNGDGSLNNGEFQSARMGKLVPGLESATFSQWDQDVNNRISTADVARTLEVAYGVRTRGGALLRNNCGLVVDYITFSRLKISDDGMVSKADYFAALGPIEGKDSWMNSIDKNRDGQFDYAEFATGNHRTDPVGSFLGLDKDLNGLLSLQELDALPDDWRRMGTCSFQGFDDDRDGAISLREYQLMPHCNLIAPWPYAVDTNNDGELPQFRFSQGVFPCCTFGRIFPSPGFRWKQDLVA
jgi:Ca2+-binding EF-hand superfamily protein